MPVGSKHVKYSSSAKVAKGVWILLATLVLGVWVPALSIAVWHMWRDSRPDVLPRIDLSAGHSLIYDFQRLQPQEALWFTYPVGSERVQLVLHRDSSGTVRAALASCTACYSFRQAHWWKNGQLICARCRHAMRLGDPDEKLTPAKGCVAVPVPFSNDRGLLTVRAKEIEDRIRNLQSAKSASDQ